MEGEKDLLAKARTSPEGENPTECTQPPEGLEYSPHTVLNGSFSPHTEGGGLGTIFEIEDRGTAFNETAYLLSTSLM
jgi:hypothetical protein